MSLRQWSSICRTYVEGGTAWMMNFTPHGSVLKGLADDQDMNCLGSGQRIALEVESKCKLKEVVKRSRQISIFIGYIADYKQTLHSGLSSINLIIIRINNTMPKRGKPQNRSSSKQQRQSNPRGRSASESNKRSNKQGQNKSKPIHKEVKPAKKQDPKEKTHNLFKIVPMNADDDSEEDQFAAIGNVEESDPQVGEGEDHESGDVEGEMIEENQQGFGEEMDNEDDQEDEEDEEDDQDEEDQQQVEKKQVRNDQEIDEEEQEEADCDMPPKQEQGQGQEIKEKVDISVINMQIQQTIAVLTNMHKLGNGMPRKHYIQKLKQYFHQYYGYNFQLIDHFMDMFNPTELVQFFEANEKHRPLTIRTNTLKTRRKELAQCLIQRGVNLDPLAEWSKVGIKIYESKVPIGATPEYLAGHYMLQSASSLLPVIALDPQLNERVLDLAAAPGGKTTYIAQLMKNTGCIFANDLKKERLRALQFNIYRMGVSNTTITCRDGRKYPQLYPNSFDKVLLDAPCTGLGIISKDHSIKANRMQIDIYKNSHIQKELLLAAIDCAKVNGIIVYSTCSVSPLENEEVVNFALKKRFIKIVECDIEVGEQGMIKFQEKRFHQDLRKTRRVYPHVHNMDGFYVAKLLKVGKGKKSLEGKKEEAEDVQEDIQEDIQEEVKEEPIKEVAKKVAKKANKDAPKEVKKVAKKAEKDAPNEVKNVAKVKKTNK